MEVAVPARIDLTGHRYHDLVVIEEVSSPPKKQWSRSWWRCLCDCGGETLVSGGNLKSGNTKSCGCRRRAKDMMSKSFGSLTVVRRAKPHERGPSSAAYWVCLCLCGSEHVVAGSNLRSGSVSSCGCKSRSGKDAPGWKGGRRRTRNGYVRVMAKDHPNADQQGYVMEHRLVMSRTLGRPIKPDESVHHINGIKDDNRSENLELWTRSHPSGKRVSDMIEFCTEFLGRYKPEVLR